MLISYHDMTHAYGFPIHFKIGERVLLKTDPDKQVRMVSGVILRPGKTVLYYLALGEVETTHYGIEMESIE